VVNVVSNPQDNDSVAALLRAVGRRSVPPREDYERVLAASRAAWQGAVRRRARMRLGYALAAGLAVLVVFAGLMRQLDSPGSAGAAATLVIARGPVFTGDNRGQEWTWLTGRGVALLGDTRLRTDPSGRAALRLENGTSLRLGGGTDLVLHPAGRIELLEGRVYLDTNDAGSGAVEIVTRFGVLRNLGTQFEVLATESELRVRTRAGAVAVSRGETGDVLHCAIREELRVDSHGRIERGHIETHDAEWAWAQALAEPPRGASLPLLHFLDWVARETGRHLAYDTPETRERVRKVVLHGTTPELAPEAALAVALATTDIDYSLLEDGTILLRSRHRQ
jgi:ferric-dicitrate binding protein FerR (iron transport regulator)